MSKREAPEINTGSMADIAFLLLIFFLVSTTMDVDMGILKRIPEKQNEIIGDAKEKNVLEININSNNAIMVENVELNALTDLRQLVIDFIDNGSGTDLEGNTCTWCNGKKEESSSEHPAKAIVQVQSNRTSSYAAYIAVQNEILAAYSLLRDNLGLSLYGKTYTELLAELDSDHGNKELQNQVEDIRNKYPQHIIDKDPIDN